MGSARSGFSAVDLRAAALLARGEPKTVEDLLEVGERVLRDSSHIDPAHGSAETARLLFEAATGRSVTESPLTAHLPKRARERYLSFVARRAAGEPVAFITGSVRFCGIDIRVRPGIFVPRPSSEFLVMEAATRARQTPASVIVDLCTGSGAIALALGKELPTAEVWGVDISLDAVRQASANARRLRIPARFRVSDLYQRLPPKLRGRVDVITGYVPYLAAEDVASLYTEVREYEPLFTLMELSDNPLSLLQRVIGGAREWLRPGGALLVAIDPETAPALAQLYRDAGFLDIDVRSHESSWDVVVEGSRPA